MKKTELTTRHFEADVYMLPDDLKCIRVTDWADYDPAKCRNGGKYRFTTTFYPVENGFEVDFSTSADFPFCDVLGSFQQCGRCQWFDGEDCTIDYEVWTLKEVEDYIEKCRHDENFDIEYIRKERGQL